MDLVLSRDRDNKFPTRGSNLDVSGLSRYCVNFNSFIVDLFYLKNS